MTLPLQMMLVHTNLPLPPMPQVAETCQLALERIQYFQQHAAAAAQEASSSPYLSVDPTPPFPADTPLEQLRSTLLDPQAPMFDVSVQYWSFCCGVLQ
jgi:hypothetical protein